MKNLSTGALEFPETVILLQFYALLLFFFLLLLAERTNQQVKLINEIQ